MYRIDSGFRSVPEGQYLDTLNSQEGEKKYSDRFVQDSIFTEEFIGEQKKIAQEKKTVVFDLDGTLRGWDEVNNTSFLRQSLKKTLDELKEKGYRLIIWSSATRDSVQQTLNKYPEFEHYWDFIITAENYSFAPGFLSEEEKNELKRLSPQDYLLMSRPQDIKQADDLEEEKAWPSFYRPPKDIGLFGFDVLVDDDPCALDDARRCGFNCLSVVPYQYYNNFKEGREVKYSSEEIKKVYDEDFIAHAAHRIIDTIEKEDKQNR